MKNTHERNRLEVSRGACVRRMPVECFVCRKSCKTCARPDRPGKVRPRLVTAGCTFLVLLSVCWRFAECLK